MIMAAQQSRHQVERPGRKQQNVIRITKRKSSPNKSLLVVDKNPLPVQVFKQSLEGKTKERGCLKCELEESYVS